MKQNRIKISKNSIKNMRKIFSQILSYPKHTTTQKL